jgi:hypothetical protein
MTTTLRRYSELERLGTFDERFEYLKLDGHVGQATFGFDRWMNQRFYSSPEWKWARNAVIMRDMGCDLGITGYEIVFGPLLIHHMNPMTEVDIVSGEGWVLDPEYLITTSHRTHNAIHYGNKDLLPRLVVARSPGDTKLW